MKRFSSATYRAAQAYLARLGQAEFHTGIERHLDSGKRRGTYRHDPSEYHRRLVQLLGRDDEEGFKAVKRLQGYSSVLTV